MKKQTMNAMTHAAQSTRTNNSAHANTNATNSANNHAHTNVKRNTNRIVNRPFDRLNVGEEITNVGKVEPLFVERFDPSPYYGGDYLEPSETWVKIVRELGGRKIILLEMGCCGCDGWKSVDDPETMADSFGNARMLKQSRLRFVDCDGCMIFESELEDIEEVYLKKTGKAMRNDLYELKVKTRDDGMYWMFRLIVSSRTYND